MANKYIRHGETYCGDGTTSAAATSNGGVGAWNNINVTTGTAPAYGALAAGDTVFIRSKDAAAANISVTFATTNFGSAAASSVAPVTWVVDQGEIWSGIAGTLTYTCTGVFDRLTVLDYNNIVAKNHSFIITTSNTGFSYDPIAVFRDCYTSGVKVDLSPATTDYGGGVKWTKPGVHRDFWLRIFGRFLAGAFLDGNQTKLVFFNPKIELLNAANTYPVFSGAGYGSSLTCFGGEILGVGATQNVSLYRSTGDNSASFQSFGLKFPRVMTLSTPTYFSSTGEYISTNASDGVLGNSYYDTFYAYDSRDDGYYPHRFATLETSTADNWAYKLYPFAVSKGKPAQIVLGKLYTQDDAAKTITVEFLWPTFTGSNIPAPTDDAVYADIGYINSSGNKINKSSQSLLAAAIATSAATWSATTYGPASFTKRKISITTDDAIKKDTEVIVTLFVGIKSVSSDDIIFVDPDPEFS